MNIVITIIIVIIAIWLVLVALNLFFSLLGALLASLEKRILPIILCLSIGYGIEYLSKSWLEVSTLFGIRILFYPTIMYIIFCILDNLGSFLETIGSYFIDSFDVSDFFKSSSSKKQTKTKVRYDSSSGNSVYQEGDTLRDSEGHVYHKDGDNKWRDFEGHCIDENDLSRN